MKLRLNNHHSVRKAGASHLCAQSLNNYSVPAPMPSARVSTKKKMSSKTDRVSLSPSRLPRIPTEGRKLLSSKVVFGQEEAPAQTPQQ